MERLAGNRLHQKFTHAQPHGLDRARMLAVAGEHDDRNVRIRKHAGRAHPPHEVGAVHAGHLPIEQHHIRIQRGDGGKPAQAVGGVTHIGHAHCQQQGANHLAHGEFVVDDQDLRRPDRRVDVFGV